MNRLGFKNRVDVEGKQDALLLWIESDVSRTKQGCTFTSREQVNQVIEALDEAAVRLWGFRFPNEDTDEDEYAMDPTKPVTETDMDEVEDDEDDDDEDEEGGEL